MKKLTAKLIIKGKIITQTGLHIGGSKTSLDIGGVDLNVVKTPQGKPFIPGSSLKGKMRSLLARTVGSGTVSKGRNSGIDDGDFPFIAEIFGMPGDYKGNQTDGSDYDEITRLKVRDAYLDEPHWDKYFKDDAVMELEYSDVKWENTINRKTGTAEHPRQLERVPANVQFDYELVYDVYSDTEDNYKPSKSEAALFGDMPDTKRLKRHLNALAQAMELLQDDYLGGQGSRGYGKIQFAEPKITYKAISAAGYSTGTKPVEVETFVEQLNQF